MVGAKSSDRGPDPWAEMDLLREQDVLRGLWRDPRRRPRGSGGGGGAGVIVITPSPLTANDQMAPGTAIGTAAVVGGSGTYTFALSDPSGHFTIVGNQIRVASTPPAGFYPVTISASGGLGANPPPLATVIFVSALAGYVPTYHLYGF